MLTPVLDCTREIRVLKALGGARSLILRQFLFEALMIVAAGGVFGIAIGATWLVGRMTLFGSLGDEFGGKGNVEMGISANSVLVSTGVLLLVGLIAGMIPAIKAARLDRSRRCGTSSAGSGAGNFT
jgi:ABC-type antimicrobial peptide transport system permease subunit